MPEYALEADPGRLTASHPLYTSYDDAKTAADQPCMHRDGLPPVRILVRDDSHGPWQPTHAPTPCVIHPAHHGHELRCITFGCDAYETTPVARCVDAEHTVRCITCHTWADNDPRPTGRRAERREEAVRAIVRLGRTEPDQPTLFEVGA